MAYHLGVLRYLAEHNALERVHELSTVSGGSLLTGLIFTRSGMHWPSSRTFLDSTAPSIRRLLTSTDLQSAATGHCLRISAWPYLLSRANILAAAIREQWRVRESLFDLPNHPVWSINATTAESGRRFRFKHDEIGDYELGYATSRGFPLAKAMAVSAAFPVGIGPLALSTRRFRWFKRGEWNDPKSCATEVLLPHHRLHLYDGGLYDNLGLESFFDAGTQCAKKPLLIIASDAGAALRRHFKIGPFRVKRMLDIFTDQNRALRESPHGDENHGCRARSSACR